MVMRHLALDPCRLRAFVAGIGLTISLAACAGFGGVDRLFRLELGGHAGLMVIRGFGNLFLLAGSGAGGLFAEHVEESHRG